MAPVDLAVLVDVVSNFVRDEVIPVDDFHDGDINAADRGRGPFRVRADGAEHQCA